jgi:hypothetical protein
VWCMVSPFDEKDFSLGPIVGFKPISNSQWSLIGMQCFDVQNIPNSFLPVVTICNWRHVKYVTRCMCVCVCLWGEGEGGGGVKRGTRLLQFENPQDLTAQWNQTRNCVRKTRARSIG